MSVKDDIARLECELENQVDENARLQYKLSRGRMPRCVICGRQDGDDSADECCEWGHTAEAWCDTLGNARTAMNHIAVERDQARKERDSLSSRLATCQQDADMLQHFREVAHAHSCESLTDAFVELVKLREQVQSQGSRLEGFTNRLATVRRTLDAEHDPDTARLAAIVTLLRYVETGSTDSCRREAPPTPAPLLDGSSPKGQPAPAAGAVGAVRESSNIVAERERGLVRASDGHRPDNPPHERADGDSPVAKAMGFGPEPARDRITCEHTWSIPSADGRRECVWCFAVETPKVRCYRCHTEYDVKPLRCTMPGCGGVVFEPIVVETRCDCIVLAPDGRPLDCVLPRGHEGFCAAFTSADPEATVRVVETGGVFVPGPALSESEQRALGLAVERHAPNSSCPECKGSGIFGSGQCQRCWGYGYLHFDECGIVKGPTRWCTCTQEKRISSTTRMIVCAICGNKRCPHATDHRLECTDSNEPGQPGSDYPDTWERNERGDIIGPKELPKLASWETDKGAKVEVFDGPNTPESE